MKKIVLVTILLFQLTLVFGQVMQTTNGSQGLSGTAGGMQQVKQTKPSGTNSSNNGNSSNTNTNTNKSISIGNANTNNEGLETVSNWIQASKCFPEIYYQVKTRYPNHPRNYKHDGTYSVWIKFKNAGGKGVKFWVKINVPNSTGGELNLNNQLAPGEVDQNAFSEVHTTAPPSSINVNIYKATYNLSTTKYIECNNGVLSNSNNLTNQTNNSTSSNTQQNDLTEYNRSKAEMEQKMQQKNQEIANRNAEAQRQQQLLKQQQEQQRQQQLQQGINQVTTATVDLITYFQTRKNALRNSLSKEDGQALIGIVNSENPIDYVQNVIHIFTDLGYTHRKTENESGRTTITLNNDINNINDFLNIHITTPSYDNYSRISFSYHRKKKLLEQLSVLKDNLEDGFTIKGLAPSRQKKESQKLVEDEQNKVAVDNRKVLEQQNNQILNKMKVTTTELKVDSAITILSILDNYFNAVGGYEKIKSVNTLTFFQENDRRKSKTTIGVGKKIEEGTFMGKEYNFAYNGTEGYQFSNGVKKSLPESTIFSFKKVQPFEILGLNPSELKMGSVVIIEEKECYSIVDQPFTNDGMVNVATYYFDKNNGLLKGKKLVSTKATYIKEHYTYYDNYQSISGILFPLKKLDFTSKDALSVLKTEFTNIKINEPNIKFE